MSAMPRRSMALTRHRHAEGDLRQDGQLVGGVGAVDVEGRVGLGVAAPLGLGQRLGVALALLGHARQDEVAGAVEDALQRQDLVGGQALGQGGDDRHAAGDAGLEGDGPAVTRGRRRRPRRRAGPAAPCWPSPRPCPPPAAPARPALAQSTPPTSSTPTWTPGSRSTGCKSVVTSSRGSPAGRGLDGIADDDAAQHERPAGAGGQAVGLFQQQPGHAAAHRAAADQGDAKRFVHRLTSLSRTVVMRLAAGSLLGRGRLPNRRLALWPRTDARSAIPTP